MVAGACALAGLTYVLTASAALAAGPGDTAGGGGSSEAILLAEIVLLLLVGRGLGELMQRIGQPAVIGQLLAGLILGPSLFGWVLPGLHQMIFPASGAQKQMLAGLSEIGVLLLLFLTGMETDIKLVRRIGGAAVAVTVAGITVPFAAGFLLGRVVPAPLIGGPEHRLVASLFMGTALSISSIKIVATVVHEMNFMRRNLGQIIIASAIMEDAACWIVISLILSLAGAAPGGYTALPRAVIGTALFVVFSYTIGRRAVFWLIRFVNDAFVSEYAVLTAILIVMGSMALITEAIGVSTLLGAFVAGVIIGESPIRSQHIDDQLRGFITAFMMPIFFGLSGFSADLTILKDHRLALFTLALVGVASVGKFAGAFAGGIVSGLSPRESLALGCGMNARGSTEVIVARIGLSIGALTQDLYSMIVTMAILTTAAMPPMLRRALNALPISSEERRRLQRELIDESGFVSQIERLLIAADDSANGRLASRIAGFIAGQRGKPITVVHFPLAINRGREEADGPKEMAAEAAVRGGQAAREHMGEDQADRPVISTRVASVQPEVSIVEEEADKGYDLMFVGIGKMTDAQGAFSVRVSRLIAQFGGPVALVFAGGRSGVPHFLRILTAIDGTETLRRGAEVAVALAPASESTISAVLVGDAADSRSARGARAGSHPRRAVADAITADFTALADRYGFHHAEVTVRPQAAADAILAAAQDSGADLIVMAAERRTGESLYVGQTAETVLQRWKKALVLVVI